MTLPRRGGCALERARAIADAIVYEGYVLYPYRASSMKNQWRWPFGVVAPRAWSETGGCEPWSLGAECLFEARAPRIVVVGCVRALRVQRRTGEGAAARPSDDPRFSSWDEGVVVELPFEHVVGAEPQTIDLDLQPERTTEPIADEGGAAVGSFVREMSPLAIRLAVGVVPVEGGVFRLGVRVENLTEGVAPGTSREEAVRFALTGVHALLGVEGGTFLSSADPPPFAAAAARACENRGLWPVLVGPSGSRDVVLASPIILSDHPEIAPESPGDLCDATEIDEILTLRTMTLTEDEKREARLTDARAGAIVDRVDAMSAETLGRLHGTWRDAGVSPALASRLRPGVRVRLRLLASGARARERRADAQDMFFDGRLATVEGVKVDAEGKTHVAVTIDDDPASDLHRWYGRFFYFALDEIELVGASP